MDWERIHRRALGAYLGFAIGDALGATVEFMTPREIEAAYGMHRSMRGGGWLKLKPGQVTDDTGMALALGDAIAARGGFETRAAADSFVAWLKSKPVDCGNTCRRGIRRYMQDGSLTAPPNDGDAGNGACMRNLPVALATLGETAIATSMSRGPRLDPIGDADAFEHATLAQCHFTHNHPLSDAGTLALGRMVQQLLLGGGLRACREEANRLLARSPKFHFDPYPGRASGYVVDTVQTVLHYFFRTDSFESCVVEVVNRGEDADTTGALAGMLAGAAYGVDDIPARWLTKLDPQIREAIEAQTKALLTIARGRLTTGLGVPKKHRVLVSSAAQK